MDLTIIRDYLQQKLKSYDSVAEFFGELGYSYADDAPVVTRNWPESAQKYDVNPRYVAQHGDFKVIYCSMPGERMLRTVQRPIIDQLAREHPFFMVVFHLKEINAWDFVNVTVTLDDDTERVRRVARRISITEAERYQNRLVTAAQRLELIDINGRANITALELQSMHNEAFDVEQVTKDFYQQYMRVFDALSTDIEKNNSLGKRESEQQALLLLDRFMFLYFIQKKGWLDQKYDYLYARYEVDHSDDPDGQTYYGKVVVPLFLSLALRDHTQDSVGNVPFLNGGLFQFDTQHMVMHLKISNRLFGMAFDSLFERYNFTVEEDMPDDRAVAIDPEMLGKVFESLILNLEQEKDLRKSTGSYYTPRTIVSFMCQQSLREYIVQRWRENYKPESPDGMLPLKMSGQGGQQEMRDLELDHAEKTYQQRIVKFVEDGDASELDEKEARQVRDYLLDVRVIDPAVGSGAFLVGMLQEIIRLITLLDEHTDYQNTTNQNYIYSLKRDVIGKCLYGVDIQKQAVRICELRLWLSLIVDYEPPVHGREFSEWIREIEPLPNLSYLVRQGNSLIERVLGETIKFDFDSYIYSKQQAPLIRKIQDRKSTYYRSTDPGVKLQIDMEILAMQAELTGQLIEVKRNALRAEYTKKFGQSNELQMPGMEDISDTLSPRQRSERDTKDKEIKHLLQLIEEADDIRKRAKALQPSEKAIEQLRNQLSGGNNDEGAFIWQVDFGEVFSERGGFDIAIANPPYIRQEKITKMKKNLELRFSDVYDGSADLYVYFFAQALNLIRANGVLTFITPNKFLLSKYGRSLRTFLTKHTKLEMLIDFGDLPVFDATTYPFITIALNSSPDSEILSRILVVNNMETLDTLIDSVRSSGDTKQMRLNSQDGWQLIDNANLDLLDKLRNSGVGLNDYVDGMVRVGVKTGYNAAFVIDKKLRDELWRDPKSRSVIKPWLRGRDVKRWSISSAELYVIFIPRGDNVTRYPAVNKYLSQFKKRLTPGLQGGRKAGSYQWWEIQDNVAYHEEFDDLKIVWPDIAKRPEFALDETGSYPDMTLFVIPRSNFYLLGILNSLVVHWFMSLVSPSIQNDYMRFKKTYVSQIPIPEVQKEEKEAIEKLVKEIRQPDKRASEIKKLERELDEVVYRAYRLNESEIQLIESRVKGIKLRNVRSSLDKLSASS